MNSLSGIFCASLNLLSAEKTHRLDHPFSLKTNLDQVFLSGVLPKENVCTENLTPFLRLLPCDNRAGLASLLNPTRVFEAEYSLLELAAEINCEKECRLELTQNIRLVFNRLKWTGSCDWSVEKVFGRQMTSVCLGSEPKVTVSKCKLGKYTGIRQSDSETIISFLIDNKSTLLLL